MTRTSRALRSVIVPAALLASTFAARAAHAESAPAPPRCRVDVKPDTTVPANLPAFFIEESNSAGLTADVTITAATAGTSPVTYVKVADPRSAAGAKPTTLLVRSTKEALVPGSTVKIAFDVKCSASLGSGSFTNEVKITPEVPLPTTIGSVLELQNGRARVTASPELVAFQPAARFDVYLDDSLIGSTGYGSVVSTDFEVTLNSYGGISLGSGYVSTTGTPICAAKSGTEKHTAKIIAHVAGAETDSAPLSFPLSVDCTEPVYPGAGGSSGGGILPDGGADDRGASGGGTDGCSVSSNNPIGRLAALFATGAAVAVLLRRRRK